MFDSSRARWDLRYAYVVVMERDHRYSDYSISKDSFINLRSNHFEAVNRKNNFKEALDILNGGSWMVPSEKNPALFDSFRYTMGD